MDPLSKLICRFYTLFLLVSGVIGYVEGVSSWSLIEGIFMGVAVFACYRINIINPKLSYILTMLITLLLTEFFAIRWGDAHSFLPIGWMLNVSTGVYVIVSMGWIQGKHSGRIV